MSKFPFSFDKATMEREWKKIELVGYLTLLFLIIIPMLSLFSMLLWKNVVLLYSYCISGVIGVVLSYFHEKMLFNYGRN